MTVETYERTQEIQGANFLNKLNIPCLPDGFVPHCLLAPAHPRHRHTGLWEGGKSQDIAASLSLVCIVEQS